MHTYSYNSSVPFLCALLLHQIASHPPTQPCHLHSRKTGGGKSHSLQPNLTCTLRYVTDVVVWTTDSSLAGFRPRLGIGFGFGSGSGFGLWIRFWWVLNDCSLTDCLTDTDVDEYQVNPFVTSGKKPSRWASSGVLLFTAHSSSLFSALVTERELI